MKRKALPRVALALAASAASSGACSLILSIDDLDAKYGATGGQKGSTSSSTTGSTTSSSGTGGATSSSSSGSTTTSSSGGGSSTTSTGSSTSSSSGCVGSMTDASNCGACNFVCPQGSTCGGGRCSPAQFANSTAAVIACSSQYVYFADQGAGLYQVPLAGGAPCACAPNLGTTSYIGANNGYVAWIAQPSGSTHYDVEVVSELDCCTKTPTQVGTAVTPPPFIDLTLGGGVTTDGVNVYWLDGTHVYQAPITGGSPFLLASLAFAGTGLAVADPYVYVTESAAAVVTIAMVGKDAGLPSAPSYGRGVQANADHAVWDDDTHGQIWVYTTATSSYGAIPGPQSVPYATGLALDDAFIYAGYRTDAGTALLSRWALDAGLAAKPTTLEASPVQADYSQLCGSGDFLYWITLTSGSAKGQIMKGDKRP